MLSLCCALEANSQAEFINHLEAGKGGAQWKRDRLGSRKTLNKVQSAPSGGALLALFAARQMLHTGTLALCHSLSVGRPLTSLPSQTVARRKSGSGAPKEELPEVDWGAREWRKCSEKA